MRTLAVAKKSLREQVREPAILVVTLLFPAMMVVIYSAAFGQAEEGGVASYLKVLVRNADEGDLGDELVQGLRESKWEGKALFGVIEAGDPAAARIALAEHKVSLLLEIPETFSADTARARASPRAPPPQVGLRGDPASLEYVFAQGILESMLRDAAAEATGRPAPPPVETEYLSGTGGLSDFQFGVPGLIIFGSLFAVFSTAMILVRESIGGTLARLKLTRLSARELLAGVALTSLAVSLVQQPLTFGVAVATGFESRGSISLALLVGALSSFSAIGLGLIVACFAKNDSESGSLGAVAVVPMAFISGAIFPLPPAPLGTIAGHEVQAYDLLPTTHAAEAMRRVLLYGDGANELAYELVALTVLSFVLFAVGVVLWRRLRLDRA